MESMKSKDGFRPLDASSFVSIMDCSTAEDNIELFNRDSYLGADVNQGWLWFLEQNRLQHYRAKRRWANILTVLFGLFFACALLFLLLAVKGSGGPLGSPNDPELSVMNLELSEPYLHHQEQCLLVMPNDRVDCNPDPPISKEVCLSRGCCWHPGEGEKELNKSSKALPPLNVPYCFFGADYRGYNLSEVKTAGNSSVAYLYRLQPSGFLKDVQTVKIEVDELSSSVLRIKLTDSAADRYEVPFPKLNLPKQEADTSKKLYRVQLEPGASSLTVYRTSTNTALFQVNLKQLIYSDQFLQLTSSLPSEYLYGIGENRSPFRKYTAWKRYTLFARDQWPLPDKALYGAHPFYLTTDDQNGSTHGVFLFNSNAMDIITQPAPAITYRTVGGVFDFFLFLGPTAEETLEQYHQLIGLPAMPPLWSLGFHLSRFGYQNLTNLEQTYRRTKQAAIPYDVQWTDIDLFQANNDFTYDHHRFAGMPQFVEQLHTEGRRFVPMFDCGISAGENPPSSYLPFKEGLEMDVFVKNSTDQLFIGRVWNSRGQTVWPDFTHPNATRYWTRQFAAYHELVAFDGSWTDMNEPSNFLDGAFNGCPWESPLETPQYTPGMTDNQLRLSYKTLCMTAKQSAGLHYNLHNLYGLSEAMVTNSALKAVLRRRPFILSRSTAPGHGHFAAHWDGDILSEWDSMKWSISSILNFNLFGVPLVGADICGFNGNTTVELCARWHQLGAFYSFARNHNTDDGIDQDPVALGPLVVRAARESLRLRYAHLAYLYSLFNKVHRQGGSVLRPLFFEFPTDLKAQASSESQFMWGSMMMVAPALRVAQEWVDVYFPKGTWYHTVNYSRIDCTSTGRFIRQSAGFEAPNVYYRAGSVVPVQAPEVTTDRTKEGNFTLALVLDSSNGTASGDLYWDAGDGLDTEELGQYNRYQFSVANNVLDIKSLHLGYETNQTFDELLIFGFSQMPSDVLVKGIPVNWSFSNRTYTVHVRSLGFPLYNSSPVQYSVEWKM